MAFNLTRMTIYALICAIEEDLRFLVKTHIKDGKFFNPALLERSKSRIEKDIGVVFGDLSIEELIDYFDLGDTFQTINSNKTQLPEHVLATIKESTKDLEKLIPIRNRVMHIRPLNFDDLPFVTSFCEKITKTEGPVNWPNITQTIDKLSKDPSFVLSLDIVSYEDENSKNHNLPLPDFDETGLIGRDTEVEHIKKLCLGNFPVISIVGEGGIGKSALALKAAYDLIDASSPFDAVIWVSSKTTQITANEIREIKGAIDNSLGVIQEIGDQVIGSTFNKGDLEEIIEYLATFKIALFIDNLETILDENIKHFVGSLPPGSKIIITSRIGLGAYEYPVKLQGIEEKYASQLLRSVSKIRDVQSLYNLPEPILRKYVNRMHRNPSYIKWFVSSIQTGLSPEAVLQNSEIFLDFCMSNVYKYLSKNAQQLTQSLQCAPGLRDIPELAYLNDFDSLQVQKSIQELMATNMLSQSSITKSNSVKTSYQLSELARAYLGRYHKPSQSFQKQIRDKRNKLNSLFEKQLGKRSGNKYSPKNIKFRDKSDRIIVKFLHEAQQHIETNQHGKAFEILQEAHRLAPDFFEVARMMAYFYQKTGNINDAREQYELAIALSPETPQLHYWLGKFLLHSEENVDDAVEQFETAKNIDLDSIEVSLALARGYLFQHRFDETQKILDEISKKIFDAEDHLHKMYADTTVQVHYRRADDLALSGHHEQALISFEDMRNTFDNLNEKFKDKHIRQKLTKCNYSLEKLLNKSHGTSRSRIIELKNWIAKESVK